MLWISTVVAADIQIAVHVYYCVYMCGFSTVLLFYIITNKVGSIIINCQCYFLLVFIFYSQRLLFSFKNPSFVHAHLKGDPEVGLVICSYYLI